MERTSQTLEPRIYVACLAAYNAGRLHGAWIDVHGDADAVREAIADMLAVSPEPGAEDYAIHDHEGFGGLEISEYAGIDEVVAVAAFLRERGLLGARLAAHFGGDLDQASRALDDQHHGRFESLADFYQQLTEDSVDIPQTLRLYIDDAMARDAMMNGEVFTIETEDEAVDVFWSR